MQAWVITSQDGVEQQRGWLGRHDGIFLNREQATSFDSTRAALTALVQLEEAASSIGETVDWAFIVPDDGLHPYDCDEPTRFIVRVEGPNGIGWVSEWFQDGSVGTVTRCDGAMPFTAEELADVMVDMSGVCRVLDTKKL